MTELWRHLLELSIELEKIDEQEHGRQGKLPSSREAQLPRTQPRSFIELQAYLEGGSIAYAAEPRQKRLAPPKPAHFKPETIAYAPQPRPDGPAPPQAQFHRRETVLYPPPARQNRPAPPFQRPGESGRFAEPFAGVQMHPSRRPHKKSKSSPKGRPRQSSHFFARALAVSSLVILSGAAYSVFYQLPAARHNSRVHLEQGHKPDRHGLQARAPVINAALADSRPSLSDAYAVDTSQLLKEQAPAPQKTPTLAELPDDTALARAADKLRHGDVTGARAAYELVALRGSRLAAFGLAQTYDPDVVRRARIRGLHPDVSLARKWYEQAAKLGSFEARKRLKELSNTTSSASGVLRR
ncbi:MAG: hypothetical protein WBX25_26665 [Rhodomicrobium sp.]